MAESPTLPLVIKPPGQDAHLRVKGMHYWHVNIANPHEAFEIPAENIPFSKPLLFYFGGTPVMEVTHKPPRKEICDEVSRYLKQNHTIDPQLVLVTEDIQHSRFMPAKDYNMAPQRHYTPNAQEFVDNALMPLIEKAQNLADIQKQFSRINMLGHSYGTVFIQTVSNALALTLKKRTNLSEEEIGKAMHCIAAVNIAPTCAAVEKSCDFTQIFAVSAQDTTVRDAVDYQSIVANEHAVLAHRRIDSKLVLLSKTMGEHLLKLRSDRNEIRDVTPHDVGGHSLRLHMNINEDITNDKPGRVYRVFQVNPSAGIVRDFVDTMVASSAKGGIRDLGVALDKIEATHLTPQGKDAISRELAQNTQTMAKSIRASGMYL
jgi:hypothetical protein